MARKTPMPPAMLEQIARTFRVLGDASRLEILQALMAAPRAVTTVVEETGKGQANVSKHLGVLLSAGLVSRTRRGNQVIYEVADPLVYQLCEMVCGSLRTRISQQAKLLGK